MPILPKSRKARRRLLVVSVAAPILAAAVGLSLWASQRAITFFYVPSQARAEHVPAGQTVRIGGLVQPGSLQRGDNLAVTFEVADGAAKLPVAYKGHPARPVP